MAKGTGKVPLTYTDGRIEEGIWENGKFLYAKRPSVTNQLQFFLNFCHHHVMKRLLPVLMGFALLLLSSTEGWSLPPCPESGVWNNCFGTYTDSDGGKYVGEWKDGKSNGQGTYTDSDGAKYVGEYKDGKGHGQGIYTHADGGKYVGEWKNGFQNGQGTYTFANGQKYVGEWKYGKSHGQGTRFYADGSVFLEGKFENGKFKSAESPKILGH